MSERRLHIRHLVQIEILHAPIERRRKQRIRPALEAQPRNGVAVYVERVDLAIVHAAVVYPQHAIAAAARHIFTIAGHRHGQDLSMMRLLISILGARPLALEYLSLTGLCVEAKHTVVLRPRHNEALVLRHRQRRDAALVTAVVGGRDVVRHVQAFELWRQIDGPSALRLQSLFLQLLRYRLIDARLALLVAAGVVVTAFQMRNTVQILLR